MKIGQSMKAAESTSPVAAGACPNGATDVAGDVIPKEKATMTRPSRKLFLALCFMSGLVLAGTTTHAFDRRMHASACTLAIPSSSYGGGLNLSSSAFVYLGCPLSTDSNIRKNSLAFVNIHGDTSKVPAGNNGVIAMACISFWNFSGGECGTYTVSSLGGPFGLSVRLDGRSFRYDEGDFAYLSLVLPPKGELKGYYMTN
jgi:hypothetical protein